MIKFIFFHTLQMVKFMFFGAHRLDFNTPSCRNSPPLASPDCVHDEASYVANWEGHRRIAVDRSNSVAASRCGDDRLIGLLYKVTRFYFDSRRGKASGFRKQ